MTYRVVRERSTGPKGGPQPGAIALMKWALARYNNASNLGIYNPRRVRGSSTSWSIHADGRAIDVGFPVVEGGHPQGNELADLIVKRYTDFGVQQVIWNRRIWTVGRGPWRRYTGTSPHTDHVHIELAWPAATGLTVAEIEAFLATEKEPDDMYRSIIRAYIAGGREPSPGEVHEWALIIADLDDGEDPQPHYDYITWSVKQEPKR